MSTDLEVIDFVTRRAIIDLVAQGTPLVQACDIVGVKRRAINNMLAVDQEFAEEMLDASARMIARVDNTVYNHAVDGNMKAVELFYRMHRPEVMRGGTGPGAPAGGQAAATIAVTIVKALVTGEAADKWLDALQGPAVIEAQVLDDGPASS